MTAIGREGQAGGQGIVSTYIVGGIGGLTMEAGIPHDRLEPSQAKPSQAKPSQAKPSQAKPSQAKPSQAKPSQAKPSQAKPSQAKPSQAKPSQAVCTGAVVMSAPARGRSRPPVSLLDSSAASGQIPPSRRPASSSDSLDLSAARRLRLGLLSALLCLPLLAGLATPAAAQTLSVSLSPTSGNEGDSGSHFVDVDIALSPSHSANTRFLLCVKSTGTATFRADQPDSSKDFDLTGRNMNTGLTVDGSNCHTYNIGGGMTTSGVSLRIFGDTSFERDETAVVELRRHAQTPSAVLISSTQSSATYTIRNDEAAPPPRTEPISLIWTETIPARPWPPSDSRLGDDNRFTMKEVKEGDSGTRDVSFYVRTERLHSSKLPFRVCVSGNATQDTTGSPSPEVEDDYQMVVDGAVQGRCFDSSIPANQQYKRMTIRVLNEDRLDNLRGDTEQVVLTLTQAPGNPLPYPWRIIPQKTGYHKLQLNIVDDDFFQQPVQFSPAEYETDTAVPRAQTRRVKEAHRGGRVGLMFTKGAPYAPYTVTYRVVHAESTATYGDDYTLAGYNRNTDRGTIRVPRQGGAALQVNVVDDKVQELEETFVIEMVSVSGSLSVNKKDNRHKLSIAIDDNSPRSELNFDWLERTVQEGHEADTHDVRVSLRPEARGFGFRPQLPEDTHFEYCVESTATPGSDYEITNRAGDFVDRTGGTECWLATIPAGQTKLRLMTLRVLADSDVHEWHERVTVRLKPSTVAAKPTSGFMGIAPNRFADQIQKHPYTFSTLTIKDDLPFVQVSWPGFDGGALLYTVRGTSGPPRGYPRIHWVVEDDRGRTIGSGSFEFRKGQTPSRTVRFRPPLYDASYNGYMIFRLTDGEYRLRNPSDGTVCLPLGFQGSCPQLQGSSDDDVAQPQPTAAVANVQVAAVDAASATVTWDAVEHATSYRVEYESTGTLAYQGNYVQGASNGHTGTRWTFTHNAAEAMTLTVTVTPEVREDGNVQLFHDLAGTATIDVAPAGTQDSVGTATCDTASLKSDIAGYIGEQADGTPHVTRWKRVLSTLGDANGHTTMTAAEAQTYADRGWSRWDPVVTALQCLEAAPAQPETPAAVPEITVSGGSGITEGGNAMFTVEANPAPSANLVVTLTVDDDAASDFLAQGNEGTQTVTIQAGQSSATLTLATENDTTDEPDGRVSATVASGTGYTVGSPNTASVAVRDDDDPPVATPVVRLAGGSDITEGGTASFTLTATPAPTGTLAVRVDVTDSGSFAASGQTGTQTVTLGTTGTATLTVATADDDADEADGHIAATLRAGTGYTVADPPDDTAAVTVADNDDPVVSIAAGNGVTEGAPATFTLTATPAPHADLTVNLAVTQNGDYAAAGQTGTREVVIPTEGSVTLEVATVNDTADEPDGSVTATLAAGAGYAVAASPDDAASVAVADDDVAAAGVPSLSVNDVEVKEGPYRRIEFTVTLSQASDRYVSFSYRVRESTPVSAKRNVDFWASTDKNYAGIRPGQTEYRIRAAMVIDDSHDEDPETFEIVLSDATDATIADGVGVATIVNSDPMPQAWLGRLGRTLAQQALDGITGRLTAPRTPGAQGTLAGQAFSLRPGGTETPTADPTTPAPSTLERLAALVLPGLATGGAGGMGADPAFGGADPLFGGGLGDGDAGVPGVRGGGLAPQTFTLRDALLGSSFTATGQPDAWGGSVALWGRAALATFDGQEDTFALDGEVLTGLLGVDYARDRWLLGVSLLQSASTGGYLDRNTGATPCPAHDLSAEMRQLVCDGAVRAGDGKVEATLTAAVPYAAFQASERLNLWGAAGYGAGEVTLTPETGDALKTDLDWTMAQMGVRGTVLAPVADDAGLAGGPALAVTSDALWARTTSEKVQDGLAASESDVTRLRLGLEGSWLMALEDLGQVTPKLAVGARHDGGDAETGFGVELGGGLAWAMPTAGLALNVEGRTLLTHREEAFQDQGLAASFVFDPDPATPRGPSLTLRQDWGGQATGGVEALFAANPLAQRQSTTATRRWAADMAWGFPAWDGAFTSSPLVGLGLAPGSRDYRLGWRLVPATATSAFALEVQALRREPDAAIPEHRVGLELSTRW